MLLLLKKLKYMLLVRNYRHFKINFTTPSVIVSLLNYPRFLEVGYNDACLSHQLFPLSSLKPYSLSLFNKDLWSNWMTMFFAEGFWGILLKSAFNLILFVLPIYCSPKEIGIVENSPQKPPSSHGVLYFLHCCPIRTSSKTVLLFDIEIERKNPNRSFRGFPTFPISQHSKLYYKPYRSSNKLSSSLLLTKAVLTQQQQWYLV